MTNIALTFSQDHPSSLQTVNSIAQSFPRTIPLKIDLVRLGSKVFKTINKGMISDIHLLLTSPVEDPTGGG
ncbi:MAG: hypothetical protein Q7T50_00235, partial [Candidatus Magasanikbacteria bacterium]|nr:hypothetical protein [Candidatus Magasanikbacteria bacterium]